jgi:hypothetical protein
MITLANRATPQALTLEQQENAMTSEGAPPLGQMPDPLPSTMPQPSKPTRRATLHLHPASHAERAKGKG